MTTGGYSLAHAVPSRACCPNETGTASALLPIGRVIRARTLRATRPASRSGRGRWLPRVGARLAVTLFDGAHQVGRRPSAGGDAARSPSSPAGGTCRVGAAVVRACLTDRVSSPLCSAFHCEKRAFPRKRHSRGCVAQRPPELRQTSSGAPGTAASPCRVTAPTVQR